LLSFIWKRNKDKDEDEDVTSSQTPAQGSSA
jgi:hypothetical protein